MTALLLPDFDKPVKLLVVVAGDVPALVDAAIVTLELANIRFERIDMPSLTKVPAAISIAARLSNFDGYIAVGQAQGVEIAQSLQMLGLQGLCIGQGIVAAGANDAELAHKGEMAAAAALHLVATSRKWGRPDQGIGFTSEILLAQGGKATA